MVINVLLVLGMQYVSGGSHIGTKSVWTVLQGLTFTNNSEKLCNYSKHILHTQNQSYWKLCTEINQCTMFLWIFTKKKLHQTLT
jgi:hypothetical protein